MAKAAYKKETPSYENKAETFLPNHATVKKAHDGLEVGTTVITDEQTIQKMIDLGYWTR